MSAQNGHITSKVILGYLLLILIAVFSVVYIYNIIEQFAGEDDPNNKSREKVYLVTNTLSLLYESEALGQMVGFPQGEIKHFNRTLNKALQNMDSLRTLVSNPALYSKIDTIDMLIEQKRWNTRRLLETWRETNAEHLYTQNIEKVIARQDTMIRQVEIQERVQMPGAARLLLLDVEPAETAIGSLHAAHEAPPISADAAVILHIVRIGERDKTHVN